MNTDRIEERRNKDGDVFKWLVTERGTRYSNLDCIQRTEAAIRGVSRWFARTVRTRTEWANRSWRVDDLERIRWMLENMAAYIESASAELDRLQGVDRQAERIAALRNVSGRTPEEAALYLAKADELVHSTPNTISE
jgi:hypothetical protein